jgi:hypothetical protein
MKAALAILLILIGGFLLYEVLVGNASTILDSLQAKSKGVDLYPASTPAASGAPGASGAGGAF